MLAFSQFIMRLLCFCNVPVPRSCIFWGDRYLTSRISVDTLLILGHEHDMIFLRMWSRVYFLLCSNSYLLLINGLHLCHLSLKTNYSSVLDVTMADFLMKIYLHKIKLRHLCSVKFVRVLQKRSDCEPITFLFFSLNKVYEWEISCFWYSIQD